MPDKKGLHLCCGRVLKHVHSQTLMEALRRKDHIDINLSTISQCSNLQKSRGM